MAGQIISLSLLHLISIRRIVLANKKETIVISLLHLAFLHDDIAGNVAHIENVLALALESNPDLIVMPELAVSGYEFRNEMGTDWIGERVPEIVGRFCEWAQRNGVALILSSPIYDQKAALFYNGAIFIDEQGRIVGQHHKVSVLPGSEGWSTGAKSVQTVGWNGRSLGLLICADAYPPGIAAALAEQGAEVLISPAAWGPGMHEPNGEWEQRTQETGLTMIVCNRTGKENKMNFNGSTSAVVVNGERVVTYSDESEAILTVEVDAQTWRPLRNQFQVFTL